MKNKKFNQLRTNQIKMPRDAAAVEVTHAQALKDGKVIADDGKGYDTVQAAQDAASSWIRIPSGTFNESVSIDTSNITIFGSGKNTKVDGRTEGPAFNITAAGVTISDLSVTDGRSSIHAASVINGDSNAKFSQIWVKDSKNGGITTGSNSLVTGCFFKNLGSQDDNYHASCRIGTSSIATSNVAKNNNADHDYSLSGNGDAIITCNFSIDNWEDGIYLTRNDSIAYANRVHNAGRHGIMTNSTDNSIVNNRISGSSNKNIYDNGTSTLVSDNKTS